MNITLACVGGRAAYDLLRDGSLVARRLGSRSTPFGESHPIYQCDSSFGSFLFLSRHGEVGFERGHSFVNYRANIYALKDLGIEAIVSWSETRALSHNFKIGQYVIVDDLIDETYSRSHTFFENSGSGNLRQWPVFCPTLGRALTTSVQEEGFCCAQHGVYVCVEGPRLETPAEARKYAMIGGELIGRSLAPEVFLAKEMQMCYASICYVASYAESGTNSRPFEGGRVLDENVERTRAVQAVERLPKIVSRLIDARARTAALCACGQSMTQDITNGRLDQDWRTWFDRPRAANGASGANGSHAKTAFVAETPAAAPLPPSREVVIPR